jgi:NAD+ synthase
MKIKIAVVQMNPIVGDLSGNATQIYNKYIEASDNGADLVVFPECALSGYPLEDLVVRPSFVEGVNKTYEELMLSIMALKRETGLIFGSPIGSNDGVSVHNAAFFYPGWDAANKHHGIMSAHLKYELPNYGVFDEKRVFKPGQYFYTPVFRGHKIGIMICEDTWFPKVTAELSKEKPSLMVSINGSPFEAG